MHSSVSYSKGWKFKTHYSTRVELPKWPAGIINSGENPYVKVTRSDGPFDKYWLLIINGYAWDGLSGPIPNFKCTIRASLIRDALYQAIYQTLIDTPRHQPIKMGTFLVLQYYADRMFYDILKEDGCFRPLAWVLYKTVRVFGRNAISIPHPVETIE